MTRLTSCLFACVQMSPLGDRLLVQPLEEADVNVLPACTGRHAVLGLLLYTTHAYVKVSLGISADADGKVHEPSA